MGISRRQVLIGTAAIALYSTIGVKAQLHFDKDVFIESLRRANRESDNQKAIHEVLVEAVSSPSDVLRELGPPSTAGFSTLYNDKELTVLNVVWAPLMVLLPHDHTMWATIGIYGGREDNIIWQRKGEFVQATGAKSLSTGEVLSLPHDVVHSVVNPIEKLTGAIHVYGGDLFAPGRSEWDPNTLKKRPLDLENTRRMFQEANDRFNSI